MFKIIMTRQAEDDIAEIGDYIAYVLCEIDTALDFVRGLRGAITSLKDMPERFALMRDEVLSAQGIHCMPYKNHYAFYQVFREHKKVIVLRVGYNRKNWERILRSPKDKDMLNREYLAKLDESDAQIERGEVVRLTPEQLAAL